MVANFPIFTSVDAHMILGPVWSIKRPKCMSLGKASKRDLVGVSPTHVLLPTSASKRNLVDPGFYATLHYWGKLEVDSGSVGTLVWGQISLGPFHRLGIWGKGEKVMYLTGYCANTEEVSRACGSLLILLSRKY